MARSLCKDVVLSDQLRTQQQPPRDPPPLRKKLELESGYYRIAGRRWRSVLYLDI